MTRTEMKKYINEMFGRFVRRIPPRRELFFVLKFGGKIYLQMTESQLRAEVKAAGGVGVGFRDKALVFQCYEIDPSVRCEN